MMNVKPAMLTRTEFVAGIAVKIALGVLYGYIYLTYYGGDDTWRHHRYSLQETRLLLDNPGLFFLNEYTPAHALAEGTSAVNVLMLYINDLQYAMFIKSLAILNLVTSGNYYLNTALFNLLIFCGHYWLFVVFTRKFPEQRRAFYVACFFYLPAVFWLSGLRIDGLLFFFVALFIYQMTGARSVKRAIIMLFAFIGIFICRVEVAALICPAYLAYEWSWRSTKPARPFVFVYAFLLSLFVSSAVWMPGGGIPAMLAKKQHAFLALEGTRFHLPQLNANVGSYIKALPYAFANTFFRPAFWEAQGLLQLMAAIEITLFWGILLLLIIYRRADWRARLQDPFILCLLLFSASLYLSIGFIVPFPGAIIRYKAIALLLLVTSGLTFSRLKTY